MWAFGVLFFYMLNEDFPFSSSSLIQKSMDVGRKRKRGGNL
jgi:hypothetical protein